MGTKPLMELLNQGKGVARSPSQIEYFLTIMADKILEYKQENENLTFEEFHNHMNNELEEIIYQNWENVSVQNQSAYTFKEDLKDILDYPLTSVDKSRKRKEYMRSELRKIKCSLEEIEKCL